MTATSGGIHSMGKVLGKIEQSEAALRKAIQSGRWKDKLPGSRMLASFLGVSGGTLGKVLKNLEAAGLIASSGPKARYRILGSPDEMQHSEHDTLTLLVLIPKAVGKSASGTHWHLVARLGELLAPRGWRVRSHTVNIGGTAARNRQWDRLIAMENPDAVVAILGDEALARWAKRRNLRILFCGGSGASDEVPLIGVSTAAMLECALKELLDRGHTRISFPLGDRTPEFVRSIVRRFSDVMKERGIRFRESLNLPTVPGRSPKDLRRLYLRTEAAFHPTAWICLDWAEFLWMKRQIEFQGQSIPDDVSLICLCSDDVIDWIEPAPSHFEHPLEGLARELVKWVRQPIHAAGSIGPKDVAAIWIPGKTVGPPPK
jgi:DNA-binding LacI/PurR family transcriptional regulator